MGKVIYFYNGGKDIMYDILEVAQELLKFESMTHKKLQKLCYYVQALYLAINKEPLINTYFEAWVHGPVSPELYNEYRTYGMRSIPKFEGQTTIDPNSRTFIKMIYDIYGDLSANKLEQMTHTEDPWLRARENYGIYEICTNTIENDDMQMYYEEKLKRIIGEKTSSGK